MRLFAYAGKDTSGLLGSSANGPYITVVFDADGDAGLGSDTAWMLGWPDYGPLMTIARGGGSPQGIGSMANAALLTADGYFYDGPGTPGLAGFYRMNFGNSFFPNEYHDLTVGLGTYDNVVATTRIYWTVFPEPSPAYYPTKPMISLTPLHNPTPGYNNVLVTWSASISQEPSLPVIEYILYSSTDGNPLNPGYGQTDRYFGPFYDVLSFLDTNLQINHAYKYMLFANEPFAHWPIYSDIAQINLSYEVPATPPPPPPPPPAAPPTAAPEKIVIPEIQTQWV